MKHDPKSQPQPWHAADEKPVIRARKGAPIGTHSLTETGIEVGVPSPQAVGKAQRSKPDAPGAQAPDPLAEPRAASGNGLLGPRR
jgi:hypothetical protein